MSSFIATKSVTINATPTRIWEAMTQPELVKQWMFGAEVVSDWQKGGSLVYKGIWDGKPFEDKGTILDIEPEKILKTTYYSPLSGLEDRPENYNTVTYELSAEADDHTTLTITQDNNSTQEAADKAEANWGMTLDAIKKLLET